MSLTPKPRPKPPFKVGDAVRFGRNKYKVTDMRCHPKYGWMVGAYRKGAAVCTTADYFRKVENNA